MRAASRQQETHLGNLHAEAIKNLRLSIVLLLYLYAYVYLDMRWYYICTWGSAGLRRGFWHIIKNAGLLSHEYICTSILLNLHTRNMIDYNHPEGQIAYETSIESKQKSMTNLRDPCNLKKNRQKKSKNKMWTPPGFFFRVRGTCWPLQLQPRCLNSLQQGQQVPLRGRCTTGHVRTWRCFPWGKHEKNGGLMMSTGCFHHEKMGDLWGF